VTKKKSDNRGVIGNSEKRHPREERVDTHSFARHRYKLEELLVGMSPQAVHEAFDWGADVGRKIVD
jgi:hypothetical protein